MTSLLVRGATVLTQNETRERVHGDVLVKDGVIEAVGTVGTNDADEVIDAEGMILLPGLVNTHNHLSMTLLRGYADDLPLEKWLQESIWPIEAKMGEREIRAGAELAALELVAGGTTTFNDMYFKEDVTAHVMDDAGLRGYAGWGLVDAGKVDNDKDPNPAIGHMEAFVKKWAGHPRVRGSPAPHAAYTCNVATYKECARIAEEYDVVNHTHAHETRTEVYDLVTNKGRRPLQYLSEGGSLNERSVLAHCGWITKDEVSKIAQAGAGVAHCPVSNLKLATGAYAPVPELLAAGANVGLGTDGPASNNSHDLFETMKFAALVHKHHRWDPELLPAQVALDLATRGGAKALRLWDHVGSLEVGKRADMVLVNTDAPHLQPMHDPVSQIVYAARASDVHATIVDGSVLKLGAEFRTLDPATVVQNARDAATRLVRAIATAA